MSILVEISENLQRGKAKVVKELVQTALDEGINVKDILEADSVVMSEASVAEITERLMK